MLCYRVDICEQYVPRRNVINIVVGFIWMHAQHALLTIHDWHGYDVACTWSNASKSLAYLVTWLHIHATSYPCRSWMTSSACWTCMHMNLVVVLITLLLGAYCSLLILANHCDVSYHWRDIISIKWCFNSYKITFKMFLVVSGWYYPRTVF